MRYLIGTLGAVAIFLGAAASMAAAATVSCGRVTTFVAPNSPDALRATGGDGWVIFAKPDGNSDKVIIRAGTQVGTLSGYICVSSESLSFTGQLAPGAAGYITEPADWVTGTVVYCGTVAVNSFTSGQLSGPRTFELRVTNAPAGSDHFAVPESIPLPAIGSYLCGRFERGGPSKLVSILRAGDPSYVAAGSLPSTATDGIDVCGSLSAFSRATATTNNVLVLATGGALVDYQLVLSGTLPPDLGARSTTFSPEIVRLVGRPVQGINTVAEYAVTRVPSCAGLPNTSTAHEPVPVFPVTILGATLLVILGVAGWPRTWRKSSLR